jgi:hypothetical protein
MATSCRAWATRATASSGPSSCRSPSKPAAASATASTPPGLRRFRGAHSSTFVDHGCFARACRRNACWHPRYAMPEASSRSGRPELPRDSGSLLARASVGMLGVGRAPRQVACVAGSCGGGRRCASTALRCSASGAASRNSLRSLRSLRSNNRDESEVEACKVPLHAAPEACASRRHRNRPRRRPPAAAGHSRLDPAVEASGCFIVAPHPAVEAPAASFMIALHPTWGSPPPFSARRLRAWRGAPLERREAQRGRPHACRRTRVLRCLTCRGCLNAVNEVNAASSAAGRLREHRRAVEQTTAPVKRRAGPAGDFALGAPVASAFKRPKQPSKTFAQGARIASPFKRSPMNRKHLGQGAPRTRTSAQADCLYETRMKVRLDPCTA